MLKFTPELRPRFLAFYEAYERARVKMIEEGTQGAVVAKLVWEIALAEVPLTAEELRLYKMMVAIHSVNGGELFSEDQGV